MASTPHGTGNGAGTTTEREQVREKFATFFAAGDGDNFSPEPPDNGPPGYDRDSDGTELYAVRRHPEDPGFAAIRNAVGEASLLDPDHWREAWVGLGQATHAVPPELFNPQAEAEADGLLGIRLGAVTGPALQEAGKLARTEATTEREVAGLAVEGLAAANEADRCKTDILPYLEKELEQKTTEHGDAVTARDEFVDKARGNPDYWTDAGEVDPTPAGGPLHWLALGANRAILAFIVEIVLGGLVLSGPVAETFVIDFPFGSLLVAMALSAGFVLLGYALGKVLHATGLPVRFVAGLFVAAAAYILWKAIGSLDALREGERDKAKTILTAATLSSVLVATLTSFAASVYGLFQHRRELIASIPTPVDLWRKRWQQLEQAVDDTQARKEQAEAALAAAHAHIDERKTFAADTDGRCRQREADGIAAGVDYETLKALTAEHRKQEHANRDAAVGAAKLAHTKTRAEAYPEPDAIRRFPSLDESETFGGLNAFHKAAIVALLIGAIGGLLGSQTVLTLGAATAAVLLLLGLSGSARGLGSTRKATTTPVKQPVPVSALPGVEDAPGWKVPPRSAKPKYTSAPNDTAQRH